MRYAAMISVICYATVLLADSKTLHVPDDRYVIVAGQLVSDVVVGEDDRFVTVNGIALGKEEWMQWQEKEAELYAAAPYVANEVAKGVQVAEAIERYIQLENAFIIGLRELLGGVVEEVDYSDETMSSVRQYVDNYNECNGRIVDGVWLDSANRMVSYRLARSKYATVMSDVVVPDDAGERNEYSSVLRMLETHLYTGSQKKLVIITSSGFVQITSGDEPVNEKLSHYYELLSHGGYVDGPLDELLVKDLW